MWSQKSLHYIEQEANDNYDDFMASRNKDFEIHMGELRWAEIFLDINANVNDGDPFDDVKE
jgi:hypothetical protein